MSFLFNYFKVAMTATLHEPSKAEEVEEVDFKPVGKVHENHDIEPKEGWFRSWFPYLRWVPSTPAKLKEAEETLLSYVKTKSQGFYVEIGFVNGQRCRIWTRQFSDLKDGKPPLVMMHGMASGLALFGLNIDALAAERTLYTIDLPGFARSSRPHFDKHNGLAEEQYVASLEEWRNKLGIEKMCLLGHSFGGYLTASYALKHPKRLSHAILVDPWGMPERPSDLARRYNIPWYIRGLFHVLKNFNPLWGLRASGPYGPNVIGRMRPELIRKFEDLFESEEENLTVVPNYMFHCNAHNPTGESAFHSLMSGFAWAKHPMFPRLADLDKSVPLTVIYGKDSWVQNMTQEDFEEVRKGGYIDVHSLEDAGHHVYADRYETFNQLVIDACNVSNDN